MATTTESQPKATITETGQRFLLHNVDWHFYETMLQLIGDRPVRLTYDRGNLELRSPSRKHERNKGLLGRLVQAVTEELEIPCTGEASTTWRREDIERGLEPDECFYVYDHAEQLAEKEEIDLNTDPTPDLAIEIDITRSSLDRQGIYAALGVPELWRFDGESLRVLRLRDDRTYEPCTASPTFPFLPLGDVVRLLKQGATMDQSRWGRMVREWVRNELAPRYQGRPDAAGPA
jgi:Uma2 family endonuclease